MTIEAVKKDDGPVIEDLSAEMIEIRNKRRKLSAEDKALKAEYDDLEWRMRQAMEAVGTTVARANGHSISLQSTIVGQVSDWDEFVNFIADNIETRPDVMTLLTRNVSGPAFRQLAEEFGDIPGLEPFEKQSVSLRTLS